MAGQPIGQTVIDGINHVTHMDKIFIQCDQSTHLSQDPH